MSNERLVQASSEPARRRAGAPGLLLGLIALIVLAAVAAGAWWYVMGRQQAADWERLSEIVLVAPAGDAFDDETPWVELQISPARPGETNTLRLALESRQGTPIAGEPANPRIIGLTARPVSSANEAETVTLQPESGATDAQTATATFDAPGWWEIEVAVEGGADPATFYLLFPDPNINGPGAVTDADSSPEGEALYQRGIEALTALQSVRYVQWLSDGLGNAGVSEHAVTTGGDGEPAGFVFRAAGGMEAIIIDSTRWVKLPGDLGWTRQEGAISIPPSEWGEEYLGATGFTILGEETIDGHPTQILAFVVPEISEPRRQTAAWYLWWIDTEQGYIRQEVMVSRVHYMRNEFADFDVPIELVPPQRSATPAAATPTS